MKQMKRNRATELLSWPVSHWTKVQYTTVELSAK